ncbi:hypothetical protein KL86DPRO_10876 [uncultured delta proteobacterium]|uniref:Uncharacterized protein n=1 Tax=uncultured delta proteobacterium TaxID=34034 RepID=A0A212J7T7_9DELT|nr:hypothetical protein KL86DPRO_10876 [uncultured delta proteobacterium]
MILFYLVLIVDSLVLQPLRCLLGFVMRFLWHPPMVAGMPSPYILDELLAVAKDRLQTLDRSIYGQGGDSAKFLGMLYYATGDHAEWQNVLALVQDDGTIKRSLAPETSTVPFSGDMLSGLLLAVLRRLPALTKGEATREEWIKLCRLWERTTWQGFPLLFANAATGKKEVFARGHIWRPWWVFGSEDILTALVWLYMGWKITGERRYLTAYYATLILQAPGLLMGCPDAQIWLGSVYGIATYNTHSKVLGCYAGWKLTGNIFFKLALAQAHRRHGAYNADICVLAGSVAGKEGWYKNALELIGHAVSKGCCICPQTKSYISLFWPPEKVVRSECILPPQFRGGDYIWERNPIKGDFLDDDYRVRKSLDVIFPAHVLKEVAP